METHEVVKKMVNALVEARGYAYTTGCLESTLVDIIGRYVDDEAALQMIHIQFLSRAIDMKLEKKAA